MRTNVLVLMMMVVACQSKEKKQEKLDQHVIDSVSVYCPGTNPDGYILYYFDATCSFCIAKASSLQSSADSSHAKLLLIAASDNPILAGNYLKKSGIRSCVIHTGYASYDKYLKFNSCLQLDKDFQVTAHLDD